MASVEEELLENLTSLCRQSARTVSRSFARLRGPARRGVTRGGPGAEERRLEQQERLATTEALRDLFQHSPTARTPLRSLSGQQRGDVLFALSERTLRDRDRLLRDDPDPAVRDGRPGRDPLDLDGNRILDPRDRDLREDELQRRVDRDRDGVPDTRERADRAADDRRAEQQHAPTADGRSGGFGEDREQDRAREESRKERGRTEQDRDARQEQDSARDLRQPESESSRQRRDQRTAPEVTDAPALGPAALAGTAAGLPPDQPAQDRQDNHLQQGDQLQQQGPERQRSERQQAEGERSGGGPERAHLVAEPERSPQETGPEVARADGEPEVSRPEGERSVVERSQQEARSSAVGRETGRPEGEQAAGEVRRPLLTTAGDERAVAEARPESPGRRTPDPVEARLAEERMTHGARQTEGSGSPGAGQALSAEELRSVRAATGGTADAFRATAEPGSGLRPDPQGARSYADRQRADRGRTTDRPPERTPDDT